MQTSASQQMPVSADPVSADNDALDTLEETARSRGQEVLAIEMEGLRVLQESLGESFIAAVKLLLGCKGRVIVSGLGKSGHVAHKIVATLSSTGSPAIFVHATEAAHGDLGMISRDDVVVLISNSGETSDLVPIMQHLQRLRIPMIGITSGSDSTLARNATVALVLPKAQEACRHAIAPTTSTTMTLALGDALAMAVMDLRGFTRDDFAMLHPGGSIGLRLMKMSEIMHKGERLPLVKLDTPMEDVIVEMTSKTFGIAGVQDESGMLVGVVTDGDLRRNFANIGTAKAKDVMTENPTVIPSSTLAEDALRVLHRSKVTALFVVNDDHGKVGMRAEGLVNVHDFLRLGLS
ncbi:MAG: KpsF/GutQ family sugar-phosphate isomerase [Pseudomonadota bacterium]